MRSIVTESSLFDMPKQDGDVVVITTNGVVKNNGCAVMGRGVAKEADSIFHVSALLGRFIVKGGNNVHYLGTYYRNGIQVKLVSFPTKEHWRYNSSIELIKKSTLQLIDLINILDCNDVYLPPVGCGNGGLNWATQVGPTIGSMLNDKYVVVFRGENTFIQEGII